MQNNRITIYLDKDMNINKRLIVWSELLNDLYIKWNKFPLETKMLWKNNNKNTDIITENVLVEHDIKQQIENDPLKKEFLVFVLYTLLGMIYDGNIQNYYRNYKNRKRLKADKPTKYKIKNWENYKHIYTRLRIINLIFDDNGEILINKNESPGTYILKKLKDLTKIIDVEIIMEEFNIYMNYAYFK